MVRSSYFNSAQNTFYEDERGEFHVYALSKNGNVNYTKRLARFKDVIIQELSDVDTERTQMLLADEPKLFTYGKQHKFIQISCVIPDTKLDIPIQYEGSVWNGRGYSNWLSFYNNYAKISTCAKNNTRLVLVLARRTFVGGILQMTVSMTADKPNEYTCSIAMYVTEVYNNVV